MPQLVITVPSYAFTFDKKLLRRILGQAGREIITTARSLIGRDVSGREYGKHRASGAGSPPAGLTGALARSLSSKVKGDQIKLSDGIYYAKFLEVGAVGGGGGHYTGEVRQWMSGGVLRTKRVFSSESIGREHKRGGSKGKAQTKRVLEPRPFLSVAVENEFPRLQKRIAAALSQSIDLKTLGR